MEKVTKYEQIILNFLEEQEGYWNGANTPIDYQIIADTQRKRYQLISIGWKDKRQFHGCIFHLDIINDKVWIQRNNTDMLIAPDLIEMGVPKHDIVLGVIHPNRRKDTEYAVA